MRKQSHIEVALLERSRVIRARRFVTVFLIMVALTGVIYGVKQIHPFPTRVCPESSYSANSK